MDQPKEISTHDYSGSFNGLADMVVQTSNTGGSGGGVVISPPSHQAPVPGVMLSLSAGDNVLGSVEASDITYADALHQLGGQVNNHDGYDTLHTGISDEIIIQGKDFSGNTELLLSYSTSTTNSHYSIRSTPQASKTRLSKELGHTKYELTNHLGNVQTVISNRFLFGDNTQEKLADIYSYSDYYPYGQGMPGRQYNADDYRFGFNGMEGDPELKGTGNHIDFGARGYDTRLGRWFTVDKMGGMYPGESDYSFAGNNPIFFVDFGGFFKVTPEFAAKYPNTVRILGAISESVEDGSFENSRLFESMLSVIQKYERGVSSTAVHSNLRKILTNGSGPYLSGSDLGPNDLGITYVHELGAGIGDYDIYLNDDLLGILEGIEAEGKSRISLLNDDQIAAAFAIYETILHEAIHAYLAAKGVKEPEGTEAGVDFEKTANPNKFEAGNPNNQKRTNTQQQLDRGNDQSNYPFQLNRSSINRFFNSSNSNSPVVTPGKNRSKQTKKNEGKTRGSHKTVRHL